MTVEFGASGSLAKHSILFAGGQENGRVIPQASPYHDRHSAEVPYEVFRLGRGSDVVPAEASFFPSNSSLAPRIAPSGFLVGYDRFNAVTQEMPVARTPSRPQGEGEIHRTPWIPSPCPCDSIPLPPAARRIRTTELPDRPFLAMPTEGCLHWGIGRAEVQFSAGGWASTEITFEVGFSSLVSRDFSATLWDSGEGGES